MLCGAEAATVVNNNAAALVLILRHFCGAAASEVVISRGELVQIGGGFRIPDVLESSGARLREVGTTNQTSLNDYARAITRQTALVLKVHRSNFFMDGFVESPLTADIAALARKKRVPFVEDLGSGAIIDTQTVAGLEHEPTPAEVLRHGVDLVCFSGDKLLGGPQAGIIAGRREDDRRAQARAALPRAALRQADSVGARNDGGRLFARRCGHPDPRDAAHDERRSAHPRRADHRRARRVPLGALTARVGAGRAQIGGGTLPRSGVPSVTLDLTHRTLKPQEMATRLREQHDPGDRLSRARHAQARPADHLSHGRTRT